MCSIKIVDFCKQILQMMCNISANLWLSGSPIVSYKVCQSDCIDMGITDPEQLLQWLHPFFFGLTYTLSLVSLTNNLKLTEVVKNSGQDGLQMKSSSSVASPATRVLFVFIIMTGLLKSAVSFPCFFSLLHSFPYSIWCVSGALR